MPKDVVNYKSPKIAVDAIIIKDKKIVLIERRNLPYGWAFPGGFVDYGESAEEACLREVKEETSLDVIPGTLKQIYTYSSPDRDPRGHVATVVFSCETSGIPKAQDDAKNIKLFKLTELPRLAFDHLNILEEYLELNPELTRDEHEYTRDEVITKFLDHIKMNISYWEILPDTSTREKLEGLAFSILTMLDGCSGDIPKYIVAPDPHESDKEYLLKNKEKYYPENYSSKINCDISGFLHELFHKN